MPVLGREKKWILTCVVLVIHFIIIVLFAFQFPLKFSHIPSARPHPPWQLLLKIFAASRFDIPDAWQMPQGGVDEGEDPRSAAIRELREETGVRSAEIIAEVPYWLTYDFPRHVREKLGHQWGFDCKGQAQKWFLLKLTGSEEEINLLGDETEKAEFGEWSWMSPEQVVERVSRLAINLSLTSIMQAVDFKKPVYKDILSVFRPHLE